MRRLASGAVVLSSGVSSRKRAKVARVSSAFCGRTDVNVSAAMSAMGPTAEVANALEFLSASHACGTNQKAVALHKATSVNFIQSLQQARPRAREFQGQEALQSLR